MSQGPASQGLCSMCKKAAGCTLAVDGQGPVVRCELFEGVEPVRRSRPQADARPTADPAEGATAHPQGLCSSCEERDVCTLRRSDGPVWQCEEYR